MVPDPWTLGVPPRKACPADMLDLSGAQGPLGCAPHVARRIAEAARGGAGDGRESLARLAAALSRKYSLPQERVSLAAGTRALLPAALRVLTSSGRAVALAAPPPPLHALAAAIAGVTLVAVEGAASSPLEAWLAVLERDAPAVLLLAHPSNPGGQGVPREDVTALLQAAARADAVVLFDEAYAEYAEKADFARLAPLLDDAPNLVITRSFSSLQGLGSLPAAYALSSPEMAVRLRQQLTGAEPGDMAAIAAASAVEEPSFEQMVRERVGRSRFSLASALRGWDVPVEVGVGPWVVAQVGDGTDAARRLAARGLRVRDLAPWGFPQRIRIRAGTEDEVARFVRDARTVLTKGR